MRVPAASQARPARRTRTKELHLFHRLMQKQHADLSAATKRSKAVVLKVNGCSFAINFVRNVIRWEDSSVHPNELLNRRTQRAGELPCPPDRTFNPHSSFCWPKPVPLCYRRFLIRYTGFFAMAPKVHVLYCGG